MQFCIVGVVEQSPGSQGFGMHKFSRSTHTSHALNEVLLVGLTMYPLYRIICLRRALEPLRRKGGTLLFVPYICRTPV